MSKQTEALKLALEALEGQRIFTLRPDHEGKELTPAKVTNAITAIREALAEQPAQQEPVGTVKELFTQAAWERLDLRGSTKLYTSPPASKPWVGLTDEDLSVCDEDGVMLARYWERVLREKNNG